MKTKIKQTNKTTSLFRLSSLSIISSFLSVALGAAVDPLVQTALLSNVHWVMCCWSGSRPLTTRTPLILEPH